MEHGQRAAAAAAQRLALHRVPAANPCAGPRPAWHPARSGKYGPGGIGPSLPRLSPVRSSRKPWSGCTTTTSRTGRLTDTLCRSRMVRASSITLCGPGVVSHGVAVTGSGAGLHSTAPPPQGVKQPRACHTGGSSLAAAAPAAARHPPACAPRSSAPVRRPPAGVGWVGGGQGVASEHSGLNTACRNALEPALWLPLPLRGAGWPVWHAGMAAVPPKACTRLTCAASATGMSQKWTDSGVSAGSARRRLRYIASVGISAGGGNAITTNQCTPIEWEVAVHRLCGVERGSAITATRASTAHP